MCRQSATACLIKPLPRPADPQIPLIERLGLLPDPRYRRGRRHPLVGVLLMAAAAVLAGARSYAAIGQWAAAAPQHTLAALGARTAGALGVRLAPSAATIRRVVGALCPSGLADLAGADVAGAATLAVDGKSARGSRSGERPAAHLLAALTGTGQVAGQVRVGAKTTEVTAFAGLLAPLDLCSVTVTADALHTVADHARYLVEEKKAHYLLVVKANQPALHQRLRSLPWHLVTARHAGRTRAHGRRETRTVRALTITELGVDFPHAVQAAKIFRWRRDERSGSISRQTIYAITNLTSRQASPERLAELARSQWGIENRLHFVRDTAFGEDTSTVRTDRGPENMATLRNLAINTLRRHGHNNIAAALRHVSYEPFTRPLELLGLL